MLKNYLGFVKDPNEYDLTYELCDVNSLGKTLFQMITLQRTTFNYITSSE